MNKLPREVKNPFCFIPALPEDSFLIQDDSLFNTVKAVLTTMMFLFLHLL